MSDIVKDTTPLNLLTEKAQFFADPSYNPQFEYSRAFSPAELKVWGEPKDTFYNHALKMLKNHPNLPKSKMIVSQEYIQQAVADFGQKVHLTEPIKVHFSEAYLSRCRISHSNLFFRLPITYTEDTFADLMRHELETHFLRRLNHSQQPWAEEVIPDEIFRRTEEGLANLHTHLLRKNKITRKSYNTYIAIYLSQRLSFSEVYRAIRELGISEDTAWLLALRGKRGLRDTSQPGGLTKDICYLEGAVQVWQWLANPAHNPHDLYLGRISLAQIPEYKHRAQTEHLIYPSFFANLEEYRQHINEIGQVNEYHTLIE